jgi:parallel beta-helix repeat protein
MFLACAVWLWSAASAPALTWFVATNGDDVAHNGTGGWDQAFATISKALASSAAGAEILVSNGIYNLSAPITVGDRRIIGFSGNPADTRVDGGGIVQCFMLNHTNSFVAGFTITNGVATAANIGGGGVGINAGGTVSNCWIMGNTGTSTNAPNVHGGGGVLLFAGGGKVLNCRIIGNTSSNAGGGLFARIASVVVVRDCIVSNNFALNYGGGVGLYASPNATMERCEIVDNTANDYAGGVYHSGGLMDGCRILGNTALTNGGGMYLSDANSLVRNCLIAGNQVTCGPTNIHLGGGGVSIYNDGHLVNCTIVSNTANTNTGGILYYSQVTGKFASVSNTIVYANLENDKISNWRAPRLNSIAYYHSCLTPTNGLSPASANNIAADPLFVDPDHGNYRLRSGSPCVNSGAPQDWMSGALDLDGRPRLDRFSRRVDMGCYEYIFHGSLFSVK